MTTTIGVNEIVTVRTFDASCASMYKAWTEPELLAKWWGPQRFTNTFHEFDLRPGGSWQFTMHGPDGTNYPNKCMFIEIEPKRIVLDHISAPVFRVIATFEDAGGKTEVTFRQRFEHTAQFESMKAIAAGGNEQLFDRLEANLAAMSV